MVASELTPNEAVVALVRVLERQLEAGRSVKGAALKPALERETKGAFSERDLGFSSFKAFVQFAQAKGSVEIVPPPTAGGDFQVVPPGQSNRISRTGSRPYTRQDLWEAFVQWPDGTVRLFDTEGNRVISYRETKSEEESSEDAKRRAEVQKSPDRYIAIEPIEKSTLHGWMTEFAEGLDDQRMSKLLLTTLEKSDAPFWAFMQTLRSDSNIHEAWRGTHSVRVREVIDRWVQESGITLDPSAERQDIVVHSSEGSPRARPELDDLRAMVHRAVDSMSYAELLKLPIAIEHILERD